MVLSNKKLKQRLRAELAESLVKSVAGKDPSSDGPTKPGSNAQPQVSLKLLLDSASQRPRLSKREKRRKALPLQGLKDSEENKGGGSEGLGEEKKKKKKGSKRKREEEEGKYGDLGSEGNGFVKEAEKLKKKKKKKKNKKNKKSKGTTEEEESKGGEHGYEGQGVAETNRNGDSQAYDEVSSKVYVGGIPFYSSEDDIRSYFDGCGTITEVDCMMFPESGKFRGIAIISFKTEAAAKRALALDGADMGGLYLKIQPYKATRSNHAHVPDFAPKIVEGYNRIYVGNLSWDITEDDLRKLFSDCKISSIRFGIDKETEQFRGYAHVDFSDSLSLTMALKLDQQLVCERPVKISCAVPNKEAGTHSRSAPTIQVAEIVVENVAENAESAAGTTASSGKIRRRTCYECGEKGHLSSACPKKQNADPTNSSAS